MNSSAQKQSQAQMRSLEQARTIWYCSTCSARKYSTVYLHFIYTGWNMSKMVPKPSEFKYNMLICESHHNLRLLSKQATVFCVRGLLSLTLQLSSLQQKQSVPCVPLHEVISHLPMEKFWRQPRLNQSSVRWETMHHNNILSGEIASHILCCFRQRSRVQSNW